VLYDDGRIACDDESLVVRWYYPWGAKKIPYDSIRSVEKRQLNPVRGRWRLWGSGDFVHWYNLDLGRTKKDVAL
jgi:Bacterial PH domain